MILSNQAGLSDHEFAALVDEEDAFWHTQKTSIHSITAYIDDGGYVCVQITPSTFVRRIRHVLDIPVI